ncbi:MAG: serine/threonine-protein phosphatase [Nitrospirae bacterium]|nr:MAG: serine/threonine-protein phosphatase [Nitrospirota bacterium]
MTDRGVKRRTNQDSIFMDDDLGLYIVADGMGGHDSGEVASSMAVSGTASFLKSCFHRMSGSPEDETRVIDCLQDAVSTVNRRIYDEWRKGPGGLMGTTISLLLLMSGRAYTAHVGDSRIYRVRDAKLEKLTKDHNQAQAMADAGRISPEEAENHKLSHVLTRSVGSDETVTSDVAFYEVRKGDMFLLSSDGMFRVMNASEVEEALKAGLSPDKACRLLMDRTIERGAPDNVSIILVECGL